MRIDIVSFQRNGLVCRFVSVAAVLLAGCNESTPPVISVDDAGRAACREAVRATLVDPASAQFSDESLNATYPDERVYKLTVNARNRLGGYAGPRVVYCRVGQPSGLVTELV